MVDFLLKVYKIKINIILSPFYDNMVLSTHNGTAESQGDLYYILS